ncbi:CapA family protein [Proteinivorax hydrogeniformans]|uniref:CapA family protein n=1 Tax=Proteinivorax hydrogeniformans TaxID=1826727 RepID=A0AAU8HTH0_9FIRM
MKKNVNITLVIVCVLLLSACTNVVTVDEPEEDKTVENIEYNKPKLPEPVRVQISAVGDVMAHQPQINAQYDQNTGEYDFDNNFKYIKPHIQESDLALANLETTLAGGERGYSGFPLFNAPDELAEALYNAGFNGISTSNNHTYDTGKSGMLRTLDVLEKKGLAPVGTRRNEEEKSYEVFDVEGIKIGVSAYTYETPIVNGHRTINGITIPHDVNPLIDSFSYQNLDEELKAMKQRVEKMEEQGAEVIIFYMHWGSEYHREPNSYQKKISQSLADSGVDIIFGSHPHVVQPIQWYESADGEHETLVVYSMGNFISNQRYETLENRYTEDGLIVNVNLKKDIIKNEVEIEAVTIIPTWVNRYLEGGKNVYEIVPLTEAFSSPEKFNLTGQALKRAKQSKKTTVEHVLSGEIRNVFLDSEYTLPVAN